MTPIRILAPSLLSVVLASCAAQKSNPYDTPSAPGPADTTGANAPVNPPANPVYDTPAAYEESSGAPAPSANNPNIPATPTAPARPSAMAAATPPKPSVNGAAIIHTVVAGDTLSGISAKYKVPAAAIKQANGMTKDTVVLGRKMVIPPH
jgi:LysM repeat protein